MSCKPPTNTPTCKSSKEKFSTKKFLLLIKIGVYYNDNTTTREEFMETISFRFDDELKKELDFIKATLNSNQSQAIKDAIHAFYQLLKNQEQAKKLPQEILKESGFIGSFQAKKDLSATYKRDIVKGLKTKHGIK